MKKNRRWYEKDDCTRAFIDLFSGFDDEKQVEVALEMVMKISEMSECDYSTMINEIADYNPADYKRWYDKNPTIHLAVEYLRDLDAAQKEKLFCDVIEAVKLNIEVDTSKVDDLEIEKMEDVEPLE